RTTIRIRFEDSQGKDPGEILEMVKKAIPGAFAVNTLKSGNINVHVPSQTLKDQIINRPDTPGFKILKKDYLLEVPGVPLKTKINKERNADNSELIHTIYEATKRLVLGIAFT
ncbi:hypothetical protein K469DRAFT_547883, partial [Zopfia rhizophila CBS 207.26]